MVMMSPGATAAAGLTRVRERPGLDSLTTLISSSAARSVYPPANAIAFCIDKPSTNRYPPGCLTSPLMKYSWIRSTLTPPQQATFPGIAYTAQTYSRVVVTSLLPTDFKLA